MKNVIIACILLMSNATFAQEKPCTLWLGDASDNMTAVKQIAEKYLEIQTKVLPTEGIKTVYDFRDENGLMQLKVWMKPKKVLKDGAMITVYTISSYKISSLVENIETLYKALQEKVKDCSTEASTENTVFGTNKMSIEKKGGESTKKNLPMATITVSAS